MHAIDALRFVLGQEVTAVSTLARQDDRQAPGAPRPIESSAAIALEMSGGTLASVHVSFRALYRTLVEIVGADGVLTVESGLTVDRPVTIVHHGGAEILSREEVSNADAYSRMLDAFSATVEGSGSFASTGEDGVKNQRVLDAAFCSWHSGCREAIV